ncbi:unnamed protein product [Allacma fusca]|uniref:Transmembrane protein 8A n=1 Tax=Allacma fusca TaxID=39272 RepID=A0A8J2NPV3_9HEXA|nr:unnamed protein product [Allacma fusca]
MTGLTVLIFWWATFEGCLLHVAGLLPQVSQEGFLRPYRNYADVTLFHYYVPTEVTRATFEFAAFMDSPNCATKDVYIYLQHGSYPVMSADNSTFPLGMCTKRSSMFQIVLKATYQPQDTTVFPVYDPLPGSWFAAAYLPDWDQHVQQEGIGHKCQYSLGSIALWTQISNVETIPLATTTRLRSEERFTYFKFYIPSGVWEFELKVNECRFKSRSHFTGSQLAANNSDKTQKINVAYKTGASGSDVCVQSIFLRSKALPTFKGSNQSGILYENPNSSYVHIENLPETDSYYYLLITANTKVSYNVSVIVRECPMRILGKNFVQHFAGVTVAANMKDQALRLNNTSLEKQAEEPSSFDCPCVPIFRLTRIKHAQDFSDTFLLEGKEWFTTWLALNDTRPVGASFEILPFVDIGGTLSISLHLDDLLFNAAAEEIHVFACVRKSRPPEAICCTFDSANISSCCQDDLTLHISSKNVTSKDDTLLIPFPEPDAWFISFTTMCFLEGKKVPCYVEEVLVSLDVRTQPCVLTKQSSPGSPIYPCGQYGLCQEVHKGQFFYTACHCIGGYRGWACSDDSEATPKSLLIATTLLLTLSNLFFIPAIVLAVRRKMFTHVLVYFATMISSTLYHACDQDLYGYCLTRYQVLQFCDFFCSILAFWITLISLAKSHPKYDSVLYMLGAVVIAIGVEYNRTGLMVFIVPFCLGIGIPISVWTYRSIQSKTFLTPTLSALLLFIPGVLLGGAGLILFAFVETEDNYRYTHSAWHVIIALSLVYLLPKQRLKKETFSSIGTSDRNNTAELAAVSDYQAEPSSSPVFFITSDLDHLVEDSVR